MSNSMESNTNNNEVLNSHAPQPCNEEKPFWIDLNEAPPSGDCSQVFGDGAEGVAELMEVEQPQSEFTFPTPKELEGATKNEQGVKMNVDTNGMMNFDEKLMAMKGKMPMISPKGDSSVAAKQVAAAEGSSLNGWKMFIQYDQAGATRSDPQRKRKREKVVKQKVVLQVATEDDNLDDGYSWWKYGCKSISKNPHRRSYYKCTTKGCSVKKYVERRNAKYLLFTYEGTHNHEVPKPKNNISKYSNIKMPPPSTVPISTPPPPSVRRGSEHGPIVGGSPIMLFGLPLPLSRPHSGNQTIPNCGRDPAPAPDYVSLFKDTTLAEEESKDVDKNDV